MKYLKQIILSVVLCAALILVLTFLAYKHQQKLLRESAFLLEMEIIEQKGSYWELSQRLLSKASEKPTKKSEEESKTINLWLENRIQSNTIPALYLRAKLYENQGRLRDAADWYAVAALTGRIDAARCVDKTAGQGLSVIESLFVDTKRYSLWHDVDKAKAIQKALKYEESNKDRPVALWICSHGVKASKGGLQGIPDAEWMKHREEIRHEFAKTL